MLEEVVLQRAGPRRRGVPAAQARESGCPPAPRRRALPAEIIPKRRTPLPGPPPPALRLLLWASGAAGAGRHVARPLSLLCPEAMTAIRSNIVLAGGHGGAADVTQRFLGSRLAALALLRGDPPPMDLRGEEHLLGALAEGRGALVVSAHLGSWELGAAAAASIAPVHSVAGIQLRPAWTPWIRAALRSYNLHVHAAPSGLRKLAAALGRGEIVVLQLDGDQGGRRMGAHFLGHRVALAAGAAWLAAKRRPVVLSGTCVSQGDRWVGRISPVGPPRDDSPAGWHARLAGEVERLIRTWPDQWLLPSSILRWSEDGTRC